MLWPRQIELSPLIEGVGLGFTVTFTVFVAVQPLIVVTVTVYEVFNVGLTVIDGLARHYPKHN